MVRKLLIFFSLYLPTIICTASPTLEHVNTMFPEILLSQYHSTWTASDWTLEDLINGKAVDGTTNYVAFIRNETRSVPATKIEKGIAELGSKEEANRKYGFSIEETSNIIAARLRERPGEEEIVRTEVGYTPQEVADRVVSEQRRRVESKTQLMIAEEQNEMRRKLLMNPQFFNAPQTSSALLKIDPHSEEIEALAVIVSPIDMVEKVFREFNEWRNYGNMYSRSHILEDKHIKRLPDRIRLSVEKDLEEHGDQVWYHFYKASVINIDWSGVNRFTREERMIPISDIYQSCNNSSDRIKRVLLRYNIDPLFYPKEGETLRYANETVEVSDGVILFEEFVDKECNRVASKSVVLVKSFLRLDDYRIINETERDKQNKMQNVTMDFVGGLKKRLKEIGNN